MKVSMRNYSRIQRQVSVSAEEQEVSRFFYTCSDIHNGLLQHNSQWAKKSDFDGIQDSVEELGRYVDCEIAHSAWASAVAELSQIPFSWVEKFSEKAREMYGFFMYGMIPCED